MQCSIGYSCSRPMVGCTRYTLPHATSSAFSASANPNEYWTKITNLTERRRIQNRIAQRNYRKKLKRKLEDLELRADSSSASPEQQRSKLASTTSSSTHSGSRQSYPMTRESSKQSISQEVQYMSPELILPDEHASLFDTSRHLPVSSYPPPTSNFQHNYQHSPSCHTSQQNCFHKCQSPIDYSPSLPLTFPIMLPSTYATKQELTLGEDDLMNPFSINYTTLVDLDIPTTQTCTTSPGPHSDTPPLTDPFSMGQSPYQSPNYFDLSLTPVSR